MYNHVHLPFTIILNHTNNFHSLMMCHVLALALRGSVNSKQKAISTVVKFQK